MQSNTIFRKTIEFWVVSIYRLERYLLYRISLNLQNGIQLSRIFFEKFFDWINYVANLAETTGADLPSHGEGMAT